MTPGAMARSKARKQQHAEWKAGLRHRLLEYLGKHRDEPIMVWRAAMQLDVSETTAKKLLEELLAEGHVRSGPASTVKVAVNSFHKRGIGYTIINPAEAAV